jgi:hypothetical protein
MFGFLLLVAGVAGAGALVAWLYSTTKGPKQSIRGAIFVTGCDSGMGRVSAERLAERGFDVIFGCFLQDSVDQINSQKLPRRTAIKIDVTSDASVQAAAAAVAADKLRKKKKKKKKKSNFKIIQICQISNYFKFLSSHIPLLHPLDDLQNHWWASLIVRELHSKVRPSIFQWHCFSDNWTSICWAMCARRRPSFRC